MPASVYPITQAAAGGAVSSVAGRTGAVTLTESDITSLTTDLAAKLVKASNLSDVANAATALSNLAGAPLASPTFTGTVTLPANSLRRFGHYFYDDTTSKVIVPTFPVNMISTGGAHPATNSFRGGRIQIPVAGTVHEFNALCTTTSGGTCEAGIYDCGVAAGGSIGTRTKLWSSGSKAVPSTNAWSAFGDPALAVTKDQYLDVLIAASDTTQQWARYALVTNLTRPTGHMAVPGGAASKLNFNGTSFTPGSAPSTIIEANITQSSAAIIYIELVITPS